MENKIITCRNGFSNEVDGRLISFRRKVQDMYEKSGFLRLYSRSLGWRHRRYLLDRRIWEYVVEKWRVHIVCMLGSCKVRDDKVKEQWHEHHENVVSIKKTLLCFFLYWCCSIYARTYVQMTIWLSRMWYVKMYSPRSSHDKNSVITMSNLTLFVCIVKIGKRYEKSPNIKNAY